MPFTHHSHSGQFCGHAKDSLEDVVQEAVRQGMEVLCMTEHMPRDLPEDLYPEEVEEGITPEALHATFAAYYAEARRLQEAYRGRIDILVGFETDWIRSGTCGPTIRRLRADYEFDMFVGSVHHVHTVPIDFSKELFVKAVSVAARKADVEAAGEDGERVLARDYFDLQLDMLQVLKPPVVGHFDLIRLLSDFEKQGKSLKQWPDVWEAIVRNLKLVKQYGGYLEINSAGLRKGLADPYPCRDICEAFASIGGRFVLSDDSHGVAQVGHSFGDALEFMQRIGIKELVVFQGRGSKRAEGLAAAAPETAIREVSQLLECTNAPRKNTAGRREGV